MNQSGPFGQFKNVPQATADTHVIPVIVEEAVVDKTVVETGTVQITKHVSEHAQPVHVVVAQEECNVEHVPAGYYVDKAPEPRWEGDTLIIPVLKEVAVVEKKLLLVEELHVKKTVNHSSHTEQINLRTESIDIARVPANGSRPEKL